MKVARADRHGSTVSFSARELRILRDSLRWLLEVLPDTRYGRGEFSAWIGDRDDAVSLLGLLDRCAPTTRVHLAAVDVHHASASRVAIRPDHRKRPRTRSEAFQI